MLVRGRRRPKKLGDLERVFRARHDLVRIDVQPRVVLEVCWKDLEQGRGPAASLFVLGDEALRFDCFGAGRGHYHAELVQPERAEGRLELPEATVEAQIERTLFELTHNLGWYLGRNPRRAIRRLAIDPGAVAKACAEARGHLVEFAKRAEAPSLLRERIRESASHTGREFETHLAGTESLLREWGQRLELQRAGRYHSVYGNEFGRESIVADPAELVTEIGAEAEALVRLWADVDRKALVGAAARFANVPLGLPLRDGGERTVTARQYLDLVHLLVANVLEMTWGKANDSRRLEPLRPLLCAGAVAELDRRRGGMARRLWRGFVRRRPALAPK